MGNAEDDLSLSGGCIRKFEDAYLFTCGSIMTTLTPSLCKALATIPSCIGIVYRYVAT